MADQMQDMLDLPRDFVKEGTQFMNRCTKPDQKEFIKICQAVGVGCKLRPKFPPFLPGPHPHAVTNL